MLVKEKQVIHFDFHSQPHYCTDGIVEKIVYYIFISVDAILQLWVLSWRYAITNLSLSLSAHNASTMAKIFD